MSSRVVAGLGVLLVAAAFGVYRWVDDDSDDQRSRAEAAAEEFASYCTRAADEPCSVSQLEQVGRSRWRFHFGQPGRESRCMLVDLEEFRATRRDSIYVGGTVEGVADTPCSTDLWLSRDAAKRLESSAWADERKARFFSCAGRGANRYAMYARRFGCRFSLPGRREGYVVIRTSGPYTFEIESTE